MRVLGNSEARSVGLPLELWMLAVCGLMKCIPGLMLIMCLRCISRLSRSRCWLKVRPIGELRSRCWLSVSMSMLIIELMQAKLWAR